MMDLFAFGPRRLVFAVVSAWLVACSVDFRVGARPTDVPDASPAVDAGSDADASEAGIPHFCEKIVAEFCADFETGDVDRGWDYPIIVGGNVELDPDRGYESARSAVFRVPSGAESATLVKKLPGPWRPTTVEFDTFVTSPTSDAPVAITAMSFTSDVSTASFVVFIDTSAVTLRVMTPDEHQRPSDKPFPYDRWVHVVFTVDWDTKSAAVALDGEPFVAWDDFPSSLPPGTGVETQVRLGAAVIPPVLAPTVNHDNFVVRRR